MKVLAIASRKGGSSKTTISVHIGGLADADGGCVIIDADPQGSALAWYEIRENERPFVVPAADHRLTDLVSTARDDGLGYVIIDTPPHNEATISEAMRIADVVVVPVRPSLFDLRAAETTFDMAKALKRKAVAVITGAPRSKSISGRHRCRGRGGDDWSACRILPFATVRVECGGIRTEW